MDTRDDAPPYFSPADWGIRPYLVKNGVESHDEKHVRFAEEICDTLSIKDFDSRFRI